jgi:hypothetical protein
LLGPSEIRVYECDEWGKVLPTFDISFEDLSGAIRKQEMWVCILNTIKKHKEFSQRSIAHCFFNDFHDANLLGVKMLKLG